MLGKNDYIDKKLNMMMDGITQLTVNVDRLTTKHESLSQSQGELDKRIERNEAEIRRLENTNAKVETVSQLARWGGLALIGAIVSTWLALSARVEATAAKSETNALSITQIQVDLKDVQQQVNETNKRVTENRESILTQIEKHPFGGEK